MDNHAYHKITISVSSSDKNLELNYDKINDWVCVAHQVVGMYFRIIPPDCFG